MIRSCVGLQRFAEKLLLLSEGSGKPALSRRAPELEYRIRIQGLTDTSKCGGKPDLIAIALLTIGEKNT